MPSRPLSADTSAVVKLATRLDNEAIGRAIMAQLRPQLQLNRGLLGRFWWP